MARHAIVSGTSRGLGEAIAQALLERGWEVTGLARGAASARLEQAAGYTHGRVDLADLEALEGYLERLWRPHSLPLEHLALVNNAGVVEPVANFAHLEAAALERAFAVNVVAPLWLTSWCLRLELARLRVVDVSSGAATSPYPGWAAYCSSKAALRMAGQVLALELQETPELKGRDVRLLSYAPHVVATDMQAKVRAADLASFPRRERFEEFHARGQLVPPEDPARELAELLEGDDLEAWSERRYTPPS